MKLVRSERVENKETSGKFKIRRKLKTFKNEKRSRCMGNFLEELKIKEIRKHRLGLMKESFNREKSLPLILKKIK